MISLSLTRLHVALLLYILFVMLLLLIKPSFMFNEKGHIKKWGMSNDQYTNMFAFGFIVPLVGVFMYFIATWLDLIFYSP